MRFKDGAQDYLSYIKVTRSKGTYNYQLSKARVLIDYFGDREISELTSKSLIGFISSRKDNNSTITAVTLNKYIQTFKRIVKYSTEKEIEFEKLPEVKKVITTIPDSVVEKVFNYYKSNYYRIELQRNYAMFKLILDTGLRINEVLNLRLRNLDFDSGTIHVKVTKTNSERFVFFTSETAKLLKRLIANGKIQDYLFINYRNGQPMNLEIVQKVCQRLENRLDLNIKIRPHKWRHTFATNFLKRGGDLEVLRLMLGHSSLKTTQLYLHLDKDHLHKEYFRMYS